MAESREERLLRHVRELHAIEEYFQFDGSDCFSDHSDCCDQSSLIAFCPMVEVLTQSGLHVANHCATTETTGLMNWSGARILCRFVSKERHHLFNRSSRVVTLGCGRGLAGLAAARFAKEVVLTDISPSALALTRRNRDANARDSVARVLVRPLGWGTTTLTSSSSGGTGSDFDVVMGSDLLYHATVVGDLLATVGALLSDDSSVFVLAYFSRRIGTTRELCEAAKARGLHFAFLNAWSVYTKLGEHAHDGTAEGEGWHDGQRFVIMSKSRATLVAISGRHVASDALDTAAFSEDDESSDDGNPFGQLEL